MDYRGYHGLHDMCYFLQSSDSSLETTIVTKLETIAVNNIHKNLLIFLLMNEDDIKEIKRELNWIVVLLSLLLTTISVRGCTI